MTNRKSTEFPTPKRQNRKSAWLLALSSWLLVTAVQAEQPGTRNPEPETVVSYRLLVKGYGTDVKTGELREGFINGTCFAVSERLLLTCAHNLSFDSIRITRPSTYHVELGGEWHELTLRGTDRVPERDLALLELAAGGLRPLKLAKGTVTIAGSDKGAHVDVRAAAPLDGTLKVKIDHCISGSPVLDEKGACVGMVRSMDPAQTQASYTPAAVIKEFLKRHDGDLAQRRKDAKGTE